MAITQTLSPVGEPPSINDPANFEVRADDVLTVGLPRLVDEYNIARVQINSTEANINDKELSATTAATTATAQASIATTKASEAAASAMSASGSASSALQSKLDAEAALDAFDDKYLGAKTADPMVDNDGDALQPGAFYINTTSGFIRVYTGAGGWVQGISAIAGVTSINLMQGALTLKTIDGQSLLGTGDVTLPKPEVSNAKAYYFASI